MLDTKQSWDDLVLRHAKDEETAYRILENRLYTNLTARFVQSHDYIAMERLFEIHSSGEYDLIVIDTPPTRNAIDFLEAPARMADFFGGRLLRWLTLPYRVGGKRGSPRAQRREPALLPNGRPHPRQQVPRGHRRVLLELPVDVRRLRRARQGGRAAAARPAHDVRGRHDARGRAAARSRAVLPGARRPQASISARSCSTRRCPTTSSIPAGAAAATACIDDAAPLADALAATGDPALADPARTARVLRTVGESYRNFSVVAMREAELRAELAARARRRRPGPDLRRRHRRRRGPGDDLPVPLRTVRTFLTMSDARRSGAGAHLAVGRRARARRAARVGVAAARRPLVRRPPAARADHGEEGHRFVVLAQVRPVTGPDQLPAGPRRHRRRRGRAAARRALLALGRDREGRRARARVEGPRARAVHPRALRRPADRAASSREEPMTLARRSGELERIYFETFDRFAR